MTRRPPTPRGSAPREDPAQGGGFGSVLRGSVNSMVGAAGLNLPLRAVERLTTAVEHAAAILERLERATTRLDDLDDDFLERAYETLDLLGEMHEETQAIGERMERIEMELREVRTLLTDSFNRVPLLRDRRDSVAAEPVPPPSPQRKRKR
jgi:hypothetical protein